MSRTKYFFCLSLLASSGSLLIVSNRPIAPVKPAIGRSAPAKQSSPLSIPLTFEANKGQAPAAVAFLARGPHLSTFLTRTGIDVESPEPRASRYNLAKHRRIQITFAQAPRGSDQIADHPNASVKWKGIELLRAHSNYFIGRDPSHWRTSIPHYARAEARSAVPGVDVIAYGNAATDRRGDQLEFDLRLAPEANADDLRVKISGTEDMRLSAAGDLLTRVENYELVMHKPVLYEESPRRELTCSGTTRPCPLQRHPIKGAYLLEPDGSVGFRIPRRNPHAVLVIDPSLSVTYSTFLGGAGEDSANSIAVDSAGKLYVGGTTTSASTFPESVTATAGPGGGTTDFFIAKIDPTISGPNSLIYLAFLGGSGTENGGIIAVDTSGRVAITGTTTSADFPVTDGSTRSTGPNDVAVVELAPTGATLVYSTLFGGSGSESTQSTGGIALDQAGEIFIASDTTSTNLPVTGGAFQAANGGGPSDGFLALFRPLATAPAPHLKYCTYLGINAQVGIGGVAVDAAGNAYIAGFTSNPGTTFPTLKGYQTAYAGDPFDAFVIKIRPSGTGASDLAYGTFLGGAGLDQALAITVGAAMPATAYVTGVTQSKDFPTNGTNAAAQSTLKGTAKGSANAFFSAIAQDATTGMTSLLYSTYLGGTRSDAGLSISAVAPDKVYIAGKTTSWDFPWLNNLQPFTGNEDAFVAKFDSTAAGPASLIYATPLAGTAPPGGTAVTDGNAIAADTSGNVYVAGRSTSADFPRAANLSNGFQPICTSCQQLPPAADAFILAFQESAASAPGLSFTTLNINFGAQPVGAQNVPPLFSALINTGDAPLNVSNIALSGPNVSSFALVGSDPCIGTPMPPRATCSFEISFSPTAVGSAEAFATITDDAPGSPHVLSVVGIGSGALAVLSTTSLSFANQPQGSISPVQAVTLFNQGNQPLTVTNLTASGPYKNQFVLQSNNCDSQSIPGGASCTIDVVFAPQGIGPYQAEIDIIDNSGGLAAATQVIALSGTGVAASPVANLSPASLTFGTLAVGTTSGPQPITLRNLGSAALTLSQLTFTGPDAASFAASPSGTTCPITGGTVAIGATCIVQIDFAPQTSGAKSAGVNFVDNASGNPQSVSVSGMAIAPTLQISITSLSFAPQSVGTASPSQAITLSNTSTSSVTINGITITGANASDFSENGNCSSVLGASASCQLTVIFKPLAAGNRSASISISDNAAGNPHSVSLSGTATQAAVSLSPSTINFANQLVGAASSPAAITVTNTGTGALVIGAISFSGANAADFLEKDTCKPPIAPAAACVINVTFMPASVGARAASVVLADNAPDTPQSIPLTGTAMNFAIDPSNLGSTSATVTAGQTATYQLDLQSIDGFAGSVAFTCTGAPADATCTVISNPVTLAANATAPFQVQVSTTGRPVAANLHRPVSPQPTLPPSKLRLALSTQFKQRKPTPPPRTSLPSPAFFPLISSPRATTSSMAAMLRRIASFATTTLAAARTLKLERSLQISFDRAAMVHDRSRQERTFRRPQSNALPTIEMLIIYSPAILLVAFPIVLALAFLSHAGRPLHQSRPTGSPERRETNQFSKNVGRKLAGNVFPQSCLHPAHARAESPANLSVMVAQEAPSQFRRRSAYAGNKSFSKDVSPRLAAAATLALSLLLMEPACGSGSTTTQPSGTPSGTYTITLTASSNGAPPTSLPLTLTVQ